MALCYIIAIHYAFIEHDLNIMIYYKFSQIEN